MKLLMKLLLLMLMSFLILACSDSYETVATAKTSTIETIQVDDKVVGSATIDYVPCVEEIAINDTKLILNQTRYQDIIAIYGPAARMNAYLETDFDSICYQDPDNNYLYFTFNGFEEDTLAVVGISSLMNLSLEGNICSSINNKISKLNQHQLGESYPINNNKINIKQNIIEERPYCMKGENFAYYQNDLIGYSVFLSTFY